MLLSTTQQRQTNQILNAMARHAQDPNPRLPTLEFGVGPSLHRARVGQSHRPCKRSKQKYHLAALASPQDPGGRSWPSGMWPPQDAPPRLGWMTSVKVWAVLPSFEACQRAALKVLKTQCFGLSGGGKGGKGDRDVASGWFEGCKAESCDASSLGELPV